MLAQTIFCLVIRIRAHTFEVCMPIYIYICCYPRLLLLSWALLVLCFDWLMLLAPTPHFCPCLTSGQHLRVNVWLSDRVINHVLISACMYVYIYREVRVWFSWTCCSSRPDCSKLQRKAVADWNKNPITPVFQTTGYSPGLCFSQLKLILKNTKFIMKQGKGVQRYSLQVTADSMDPLYFDSLCCHSDKKFLVALAQGFGNTRTFCLLH